MNKRIVSILICTLLTTNFLVMINAEESIIKEKTQSIVFSKPNIQEEEQFITLGMTEATSYLMNPGKPILPIYNKVFIFPFGTQIKEIICEPIQISEEVLSKKIQPLQTPVVLVNIDNLEENKVFKNYLKEDNTFYESTDFFPNSWYDYNIGCGLDDSNHVVFLTVRFYPVRYSPGQNKIKYANKVDIKVRYYEPAQPIVFKDECDMVIITPSEFSEDLQPLVDYKNDCSVSTKLVTLEEIYTGFYFPVTGRDNQEKIKYFIKDAVEQWNITYVLLAGGANKIPVRMSYIPDSYEVSIISDLYYADIFDSNGDFCSWDSNGNNIFGEYNYLGRTDFVDLRPDVCLGRLSFRGSNEVSGVVNKIITYESTGAYMEDWFSNFLVCGGDTFPDYNNIDEGEYLNQNAIDMMDGFIPNKIWATNGKLQFAINIESAIENGTGFFYITGHGTNISWATHPHNDFETWWPIGSYFYLRAELLTNQEKLPIIIIGGCSNCDFSGGNCFGWSFIKNSDGGGVASYGNSALGYGYTGFACTQGLTGAMELSAFNAYAIQNAKTTGDLWTKALNYYLNQYWFEYFADYKTVEEWQAFTDPSMRITKVSDKPIKPGKPSGYTFGQIGIEYDYSVHTTDPDNDQVKYCLDWGDETFSWSEKIESGENAKLSHTWEKPGTYAVKVKARDAYGLDSKWSEPLLVTIVSEAPFFDIVKIGGGFAKIRTVVNNTGLIDAYNVTCNVSVVGGILNIIDFSSEKILENLTVGKPKLVKVGPVFGFGKIKVTVTISAPSANTATKSANGFIMGPIIFVQ